MPGRIAYNRPIYGGGRGQFSPAYHYEMVSDPERTVDLAPGVIFYGTDALMLPSVLPLRADAAVQPGTRTLALRYSHRSDLGSVEVWLE